MQIPYFIANIVALYAIILGFLLFIFRGWEIFRGGT